jgi:hypothetical protein
MSDESIANRVGRFVGSDPMDKEELLFYVGRLIESCQLVRKRAFLGIGEMVGLGALFLLMATQDLSEAELFGIKIQNFNFFLLAIPVGISFLFARTTVLLNSYGIYQEVFHAITSTSLRTWRLSGLDTLILLGPGQLTGSQPSSFLKPGAGRRIDNATEVAELLFAVFAPGTFVVYAYIQLFSNPQIPFYGSLISIIISAIFLVLGGLQIAVVRPFLWHTPTTDPVNRAISPYAFVTKVLLAIDRAQDP